jgi:hypothetical protein
VPSSALVLGRPAVTNVPMHPDELSLRLLVKAMAEIDVEITPQLVQQLGQLVAYWPRPATTPTARPTP